MKSRRGTYSVAAEPPVRHHHTASLNWERGNVNAARNGRTAAGWMGRGIMATMNPLGSDWVTIAGYENVSGCRRPMAAVRA